MGAGSPTSRAYKPEGTNPNTIEYLVRWLGYGPEYDNWINVKDLGNARELVEGFERDDRKDQETALPQGNHLYTGMELGPLLVWRQEATMGIPVGVAWVEP